MSLFGGLRSIATNGFAFTLMASDPVGTTGVKEDRRVERPAIRVNAMITAVRLPNEDIPVCSYANPIGTDK